MREIYINLIGGLLGNSQIPPLTKCFKIPNSNIQFITNPIFNNQYYSLILMFSFEPKIHPQIIIPRPVKKYSTDLSILEGTEASDDVELFSPTKIIHKKGSMK